METNDLTAAPAGHAPSIRQVDMNRPIEWIKQGFNLVVKFPMPWVILMAALIVSFFIIAALPLAWVAGLLGAAAMPVIVGEMMRHLRAQQTGKPHDSLQFGSQPLWILGAIGAGLTLALNLIGMTMGVSAGAGMMLAGGGFFGLFGLVMIVQLALSVMLTMALWQAPVLVVFDRMDPIEAIKLSFKASTKNIGVCLVFGLIVVVLGFFATLPLMLGWLVLAPVLISATYIAYQDMFAH